MSKVVSKISFVYERPSGKPFSIGLGFKKSPGLLHSCRELKKLASQSSGTHYTVYFNVDLSKPTGELKLEPISEQVIGPKVEELAREAGVKGFIFDKSINVISLWMVLRKELCGSILETLVWPLVGAYRYVSFFRAEFTDKGAKMDLRQNKTFWKTSPLRPLTGLWEFSRWLSQEARSGEGSRSDRCRSVNLNDITCSPELITMLKNFGLVSIDLFQPSSPREIRQALRCQLRSTPFWFDYFLKPLLAAPWFITALPALISKEIRLKREDEEAIKYMLEDSARAARARANDAEGWEDLAAAEAAKRPLPPLSTPTASPPKRVLSPEQRQASDEAIARDVADGKFPPWFR